MSESVPLWITLLGFAAPLVTLAGSAVAYVIKIFLDAHGRRRQQFFELMSYIDDKEKPIATKVAAVYRLREFRPDSDFIIRFCESQQSNISGDAADLLKAELAETAKFLRNKEKNGRRNVAIMP